MAFRSATPAAPSLPLRIRSAGRYELPGGWEDTPHQKWFVELFWGAAGRGEFRVGEEWVLLDPGQVFFYWPGDTHHARSVSEVWSYCWVTFDHADAARWVEAFGFAERRRDAGPCPESMFLELIDALNSADAVGEVRASNLGHQLLAAAATSVVRTPAPGSLASRARAMIDQRFAEHDFTVELLADLLHMHRSTLFRQFAAAHGLSPSAYLQNLRLQRGISLLREGDAPVQEVALAAGFTDANYFARAIRRVTGLSPRALRRS